MIICGTSVENKKLKQLNTKSVVSFKELYTQLIQGPLHLMKKKLDSLKLTRTLKDRKNILPEETDPKKLVSNIMNSYDSILSKIIGNGTYMQQLRIILGNWYFSQFYQKSKVTVFIHYEKIKCQNKYYYSY